jgi:hypothetical protein
MNAVDGEKQGHDRAVRSGFLNAITNVQCSIFNAVRRWGSAKELNVEN